MLILDARVLILTALIIAPIVVYVLLTSIKQKNYSISYLLPFTLVVLASTLLMLFMHAHWILPALFVQKVSLPQGYDTVASADFFSFARLAHAITWSHPNYPDNIFGKVNEVSPFAFIFPVLAFLAIKLKPSKLVIYFTLTSLLFAFLAKGTNEPFGQIYLWLFENIPGMNLFRDSTKFYIPLSLCFAYLIATSIERVSNAVAAAEVKNTLKDAGFYGRTNTNVEIESRLRGNDIFKFLRVNLLLFVASATIVTAWFPTFSHQIKGTLQYRTYPPSFQKLEEFLQADQSFGRILWIPTREIYGYSSLNHPAVSLDLLTRPPTCLPVFCLELPGYPQGHQYTRQDLSTEIAHRMAIFDQSDTENYFQRLAINYVVLVPDYDGQIYTLDYQPDRTILAEYKAYLDQSFILQPLLEQNDMSVYRVHNKGVFLSDQTHGTEINYRYINPAKYEFQWSGGELNLLMSQSFDNRWIIRDSQGVQIALSSPTSENLNQFKFSAPSGTYTIAFAGQVYADIGWQISQITLFIVVVTLVMLVLHQKFKRSRPL